MENRGGKKWGKKMPLEDENETIEIDSLSNAKEFWRVKQKEKRINQYHVVIHILAFLILIPFIVFISFGMKIPESYSTIVSVVIGFYFARNLFN